MVLWFIPCLVYVIEEPIFNNILLRHLSTAHILREEGQFVIFKFDTNKSKNTILMVCLKMKCFGFANTKSVNQIEDWWYGVDMPDKTNGVWSMDSCARTNQIKLLMNGLPPPGILVVIFNKISHFNLIDYFHGFKILYGMVL